MKILGQVAVYPAAPSPIARLSELAYNLWWSWHPTAQALFAELDAALWESVDHNPVKLLRLVSQQRLEKAAADPHYLKNYQAVLQSFDSYMHPESTWYDRTYPGTRDRLIAYFSAEFGLHEALPIYSGGLGILSGDHCKTASDLGLPFVGMGFLYPQGYFQQRIDADGRQQAIYQKLDLSDAPAVPALGADRQQVTISVDMPGRTVFAKLWRIQVGRIAVYLMDTDVERNAPSDRELSARLYGGNQEMRISQEIVLGIGGVRALRALGQQPAVWHMNEGHAAFLQLERMREYVQQAGLGPDEALWAAQADALFTTHTPVPAGNDSFPFELMDRFFSGFWGKMNLDRARFLALGRFDYSWGPQFSMTVLALRTSGQANGVSRLHGEVSRRMWCGLWPDVPKPEIPIGYVTNGVHTETWLHPGMTELFDRYLGQKWRDAIDDPATWKAVSRIPDDELWGQHSAAKAEMLALVRERLIRQLMRIGAQPAEVNAAASALDPRALTIGFARRFATYKRATLLFRDRERLKKLLNDPERPVQVIFAGKAHPADEPGKALIQTVYELSRSADYAGKIVFVEDYDANVARHLVAGVDAWLNTPRRPLEASGTSGEKAGLNGVPNFSILDGWWSEGYDARNGWAIGQEREYSTEASQDEADALSMYSTLEQEIIPAFYDLDAHQLPARWLGVMRASIQSVAPAFSFDRMLKQYVATYYTPAGARGRRVDEDGFAGARDLSVWQARVTAAWSRVSVSADGPAASEIKVGEPVRVQAVLRTDSLSPDDLAVELVFGRGRDGDLDDAAVLPLHRVGGDGGEYHFEGELRSPESGMFVYGVRVRPQHALLPNPFAAYLVRWA